MEVTAFNSKIIAIARITNFTNMKKQGGRAKWKMK